MADPRAAVDFEGIDGKYETFVADGSTIQFDITASRGSEVVDLAVTLSANSTVALAGAGTKILGRLERVESDGRVVVQTGGYTTLPGGASATLTAGLAFVGAVNGDSDPGYIRAIALPGGTYAEAAADDVANGRGSIIDSTTATAVKVRLD